MSDKIEAILSLLDPTPQVVHEGQNALSRLWRLILMQLKMRYSTWNLLLDNYTMLVGNNLPKVTAENIKGNLLTALCEEKITWKNFLRALELLNYPSTRLTFTFTKGKQALTEVIHIKTVAELFKLDTRGISSIPTDTKVTPENSPLISMEELHRLNGIWESVKDAFLDDNWNELLVDYSKRVESDKSPSAIRSGVKRNLGRPSISWESFVVGLEVCQIKTLNINVYFGGKTSLSLDLLINLK